LRRYLAAGSLLLGVLVVACGPDWDALDPEGGGGNNTTLSSGTCTPQDDFNGCTIDLCNGPVTDHIPIAFGIPCEGGEKFCDGEGNCVECVTADDCTGGTSFCKQNECDAGTCFVEITANGTELPPENQTDGNCSIDVCNEGTVTPKADTSDFYNDNSECTDDYCDDSGMSVNSPIVAGTACANGTMVCNGNGGCVECNQASDCGMSFECLQQSCDANGMCDPTPELPPGTSCENNTGKCNGQGGCFTCQTTTSASFLAMPSTFVTSGTSFTSTIPVAGLGAKITDVNVTVDISGDTSGDLEVILTSPAGTPIDLTSRNGGTNDNNFAGTTFDDDSMGKRVTEATFVNGLALPNAIPERNLGRLNGESPNGSWKLMVTDIAGGSLGSTFTSWSLSITSQPDNLVLAPTSFMSMGLVPIQDGPAAVSNIVVSGAPGVIYKATVTVNIEHKSTTQLVLTLVSPAGKSIALSTNQGPNGAVDAFLGTTFDDNANALIGCPDTEPGCVTFPNGPLLSAIPEGSLSALVGDDPNGTWTLKVADTVQGGQTGMINSWSLTLTPALCSLTP
jgi:subtilisin-like proprotein convertase family protein